MALADVAVVLTASDVNLSIFKPLWLTNNQILRQHELTDDTVIAPGVVRVPARDFELLILPNRIQLQPRLDKLASAQEVLLRVLGGIVSLLPHTPYKAMGLNFAYLLARPDEIPFSEWCARQFATPCSSVVTDQNDDEARFGTYFSFEFSGLRLKVTVLPTRAGESISQLLPGLNQGDEVMRAECNYHRDLDSPPDPNLILATIEKWPDLLDHSGHIIEAIAG